MGVLLNGLQGILEGESGGENGGANEGLFVGEMPVGSDASELSLLGDLIHGGFLDALGEEEG